jgi:hypothetical protein
MTDDTTRVAIVAAAINEIDDLVRTMLREEDLTLADAEHRTWEQLRDVGAQLLERSLAARGTGKAGAHQPCACGGQADFEGYRPKAVQTRVGWITVRRAYYHCPACGQSQIPLDDALGVARDQQSPGVRRLATRCGALLPFTQAAATLAETAGIVLSASTIRGITEAVGAQREQEVEQQVADAWDQGLPKRPGIGPDRLYLAMDGVRILTTDGSGKEAKVGVIAAEEQRADGRWQRQSARYVVSFAEAMRFGQRLALAAHGQGLEQAAEVVVLGDGAEWIWQLAAEHAPQATCIVDWYHASERIWEMGRAQYGEGTAETRRWVEEQLTRLAKGEVAQLVPTWQALPWTGSAAEVRDEQVTYFTNQASRMAYDGYRTRGLAIGSGMVESACKTLIGMREKGPGMRWTVAGAQAVANVRVLLFNHEWDAYDVAA